MSFESGSITTTLGLDISPYASGMMTATSIASIFPSTVTSFLANPLLGVIDITKQLGAALIETFSSSMDKLDDLGDSALSLGVSVETLSSLQRVGKMSGISDMGDSLKFLAKNAADAGDATSPMAATFRKAGIAALDAAGNIRPVEDLMMDLADAISASPVEKRVGLAMDLLGRSGGQMVGVLSQGSGALRQLMSDVNPLGGVMSSQAAAAAGAFNDMKDEIGFAWDDTKSLLAQELMPGLKPMLADLLGYIRTHGSEIRSAVSETAASILNSAAAIVDALAVVGRIVEVALPIMATLWGYTKGAGMGTVIGGLVGSIIPGAGTAAGATIGGYIGGAIGGGSAGVGGYYAGQGIAGATDMLGGSSDALRAAAARVGKQISDDVTLNLYDGWKKDEQRRSGATERAALEGRYQ